MALRMATRLRTVEDIIGCSQNLPSASTKKFVSAALPARARFFPFAKICEIPKSDRPISSRCIPLKAEGAGQAASVAILAQSERSRNMPNGNSHQATLREAEPSFEPLLDLAEAAGL